MAVRIKSALDILIDCNKIKEGNEIKVYEKFISELEKLAESMKAVEMNFIIGVKYLTEEEVEKINKINQKKNLNIKDDMEIKIEFDETADINIEFESIFDKTDEQVFDMLDSIRFDGHDRFRRR